MKIFIGVVGACLLALAFALDKKQDSCEDRVLELRDCISQLDTSTDVQQVCDDCRSAFGGFFDNCDASESAAFDTACGGGGGGGGSGGM